MMWCLLVQSKVTKQYPPWAQIKRYPPLKSPSASLWQGIQSLLPPPSLARVSKYAEAYILHLEAFRKALSFSQRLLGQHAHAYLHFSFYFLAGGLYEGQVAGPGSCGCPWTTLLSSPTALEWLPVLGWGFWTGTKSLPPQMLLSHQILCQVFWVMYHAPFCSSSRDTRDNRKSVEERF